MTSNPHAGSGSHHYPALSATYSGTHTPETAMSPYHAGHASYPPPPPASVPAAASHGMSSHSTSAYSGHIHGTYSPQYQTSGTRTPNGGGSRLSTIPPPDFNMVAAAGAGRTQAQAEERYGGEDDDDEDDEEEEEEEEEEEDEDEEDEDEQDHAEGSSSGAKKRKRDSTAASRPGNTKRKADGPSNAANGSSGPKNAVGPDGKKPKPSRGAKACTNCRRLKMRCVGAEKGPPCNRCRNSGHDCIFEQSNRGKKGNKGQRAEAMAQSLKKMEATLATVLKSIRHPSLAAQLGGMATRSPSPVGDTADAARADRYTSEQQEPHFSGILPAHEALKRRSAPRTGDLNKLVRDYEENKSQGQSDEAAAAMAAAAQEAFSGGSLDPVILAASRSSSSQAPSISAGSPADSARSPALPVSLAARAAAVAAASSGSMPATAPGAAATTGTRFLEPMPHYHRAQPMPQRETVGRYRSSSPRMHALPDNTLNPLGLLAEASLHNSHKARRQQQQPSGHGRSPSNSTSKDGTSPATGSGSVSGSNAAAASGSGHASSGKGSVAGDRGGAGSSGGKEPVSLGVANETYFKPGPMTILPLRQIIIERDFQVEILTQGIVSSEEVLDLFKIFFNYCMQHVFLLDPDWHTPEFLCSRSRFLFTCVCTVAARFYTRRPELHAQCFMYARKCAFEILDMGYKSVEIVQGFLLLSMWCQPSERFEQDLAWLFSGVAIRIATDLNLHRKSLAALPGLPQPDDPTVLDREREIMNRERTWYICFVVDRSLSGQMGKPYTIREDWLIRNCRHWCLQRLSKPWDVGISAMVELQRIQSRQIDFLYSSTASVSGLNLDIDYPSVLRAFNEQLDEWRELWRYRGLFQSQDSLPKTQPGGGEMDAQTGSSTAATAPGAAANDTRGSASSGCGKADSSGEQRTGHVDATTKFLDQLVGREPPPDDADHTERTMYFLVRQAPIRFNYAVLVLNSFGLQHAIDHPALTGLDKPMYYMRCLTAARGMVQAAFALGPVMRYAPDSQYVMITYACVFLLKLIRPAFSGYSDEDSVVQTVSQTASFLDELAVNETHTPALYATFLRTLLQSRLDQTEGTRSGAATPHRGSRAGTPSGAADATETTTLHNTDHNGQSGMAAFNGNAIDPSIVNRGPAVSGGITMMPGGRDDLAINTMQGMDATQMLNAVNNNTDQLLNESFWSSLLPPGFGGPLDGTGGHGLDTIPATSIFCNHQQTLAATPGVTPGITRPSTPSMMNSFPVGLTFNP